MLYPKPKLPRSKPAPTITVYGRREKMSTLRHFVITRDGCFAAKCDPGHVCELPLTLEHLKRVHSDMDPRQHNERHTVGLCLGLNGISIASHELRERMRDHLRRLYPDCGSG